MFQLVLFRLAIHYGEPQNSGEHYTKEPRLPKQEVVVICWRLGRAKFIAVPVFRAGLVWAIRKSEYAECENAQCDHENDADDDSIIQIG